MKIPRTLPYPELHIALWEIKYCEENFFFWKLERNWEMNKYEKYDRHSKLSKLN